MVIKQINRFNTKYEYRTNDEIIHRKKKLNVTI